PAGGAGAANELCDRGHRCEEHNSDSPSGRTGGKRNQVNAPLERTNMSKRLTAIIQAEGDGFVALCPELDIASQGGSIVEARDNLREALELFFECAPPAEVQERLAGEVFV